MRLLVVLAHETRHAVESVEPHQSHELIIVVSLAADQIDGPEPGNAARFDTRNDLPAHDALVGIRVVLGRPASPHPADHDHDITPTVMRTMGMTPPSGAPRRSYG